ncbi:MAG: hypothetical protein ACOC2Y_02785 [Spirochaetota bacterium]
MIKRAAGRVPTIDRVRPAAYAPFVTSRHRLIAGAGLAVAFVGLNTILTAFRWIPSASPVLAFVPSLEAAAVVLAGSLPARLRPHARLLRLVVALPLALLIAYSSAETFYRYYYARPFDPWTDISFVRGGLYLLFGEIDSGIGIYAALTIVVIVGIATALAWLITTALVRSAARTGRPLVIMSAAAAAMLVTVVAVPSEDRLSAVVARGLLPPAADGQVAPSVADGTGADVGNAGEPRPAGLGGADVHLFFVESYGRTAFTRPEVSRAIVPSVRDHEDALARAGYHVRSTYLRAPVVGGYSWVSELAFLTGRDVENQADYDAVMSSDSRTLSGFFADAGYLTLLSMPGTIHGEWPEAQTFYRFEEVILGDDFDYVGPQFSFVWVPDQLAVAQAYDRLRALRARDPSRPAYAQHVLVSSHAPYNRIPPYLTDWGRLGNGAIYNEVDISTYDNDWLRGSEFLPGYSEAVIYSLDVVFGFLTSVVDEDVVAIVTGDHQPGPQVRPPGAGPEVPIHIIARDQGLVDSFADLGFSEGLIPSTVPPHEESHWFLDSFLAVVRE